MVKFTEIFQGPVVYDEEKETNVSNYDLREVYINPRHVICTKVAVGLQNKAKNREGALIEGLFPNTPYTHIIMHCPSQPTAMTIAVVGSMNHVIEKITAAEK